MLPTFAFPMFHLALLSVFLFSCANFRFFAFHSPIYSPFPMERGSPIYNNSFSSFMQWIRSRDSSVFQGCAGLLSILHDDDEELNRCLRLLWYTVSALNLFNRARFLDTMQFSIIAFPQLISLSLCSSVSAHDISDY